MKLDRECFYTKELNENKIEVSNLQTNFKTLNRKLMHAIAEKDAQISQLQQSVARKPNQMTSDQSYALLDM